MLVWDGAINIHKLNTNLKDAIVFSNTSKSKASDGDSVLE